MVGFFRELQDEGLGASGLGDSTIGNNLAGFALAGPLGLLGSAAGVDVSGGLQGAADRITGESGAQAAKDAARRQTEFGERGIDEITAAQMRLSETLAPFTFGQDFIPRAEGLFGAGAGEAILNDPVLTALQEDAQRKILASQAARGRSSLGETDVLLQDAFLRTGADLLSQERGDLLNAIQVGRAPAQQTAISDVATSGNIADILASIGNVQAAGIIGANQARDQGFQNILDIGSTLATSFGGGA